LPAQAIDQEVVVEKREQDGAGDEVEAVTLEQLPDGFALLRAMPV
jgi:hypothetical protein